MDRVFRRMGDGREVDLLDYARAMISKHPDLKIIIGSDSQNHSTHTVYVTTLLFRFEKRGAHVIYNKEKVRKNTDLWSRLWGELDRSVTLATLLTNEANIQVDMIDLDFNEDPACESHKVYSAAMGYVESLGFNARGKPQLLMATWAANSLCH